MNNIKLLFFISIVCALKGNAQNYLISFTGTGASTTVNSVKVENLTAGTSLTINGSDILQLTSLTGINLIENKQSSELKIYPNPMTDNSMLQIYPPEAGVAIISVVDMSGKLMAQIHNYLENYLQEFRLSGLNKGFYLISVKGNTYQYSGKLLCNGMVAKTVSLEKISDNKAVDERTSKMDYKGVQTLVDMAYSNGDRIKFTGISGNFSTVMTDILTSNKTITFNFIACKDADNNSYPIVNIGTQTWMEANLKTTKYSDGTSIPLVTDNTEWAGLTAPAYCWFNNDEAKYKTTYGALYNFYAVVDSRNLCPSGWHSPTDLEWKTLEMYLGMTQQEADGIGFRGVGQAAKLKSTSGWAFNGTNESGFSVIPTEERHINGDFIIVPFGLRNAQFWTATEISSTLAGYRSLDNSSPGVFRDLYHQKGDGKSVRCIKD